MKTLRTIGIGGLAAALLFGGAASASAAIYSPEGRPLIETSDLAGSGEYDEWNGAAAEASFRHPASVAVLSDGTVLVADTGNHRIRKIAGGEVSVFAGTEVSVLFDDAGLPTGALEDGSSELSFFWSPSGLDVDARGNVYVADKDNHAIRKIARDGTVSTIAGNGVFGFQDGSGAEAAFYAPSDVAVAKDGTVYIADTLNHVIRKIAPNGAVTTLTKASDRVVQPIEGLIEDSGDFADGPIGEALFNEPSGLALDAKGNLFVSDTGNQRIRYIDFAAGTVTTVAGGGAYEDNALYAEGFYVDGPAAEARFFSPKGLAVDAEGGLYIADSLNHSIRYLKDGNVVTVVGNAAGDYGKANGVDERAQLDRPTDVAIAADGSLIVADTLNGKIRKVEFYALPAGWTNSGSIRVLYNNDEISFDARPEIRSNRTMVPVRAIAEAMGYDVEFQGNDIVLSGPSGDIKLTLGIQEVSKTANGATETTSIDAAPYVSGSRTYVPIRFFAEQIGVDVDWHGPTTTVILRD
ncbi:stalk domain-containing protein [Paenibacillus sp.]|uniref:stalk domain-containing protein n=1 Tax=Paenibacillus sp. TaxID=58172 RepID=UPI002D6E3AEB|nr:stalk domain-containing protein [Paenibacillus sp.]HZG87249.1 stalk domain-containing protein [Paenibacillus sp.]